MGYEKSLQPWSNELARLRGSFEELRDDIAQQVRDVTTFAEKNLLDAGAEVGHFYQASETLTKGLGKVHEEVSGQQVQLSSTFADFGRFFGTFIDLLDGFFAKQGHYARDGRAQTAKMVEGSKRIAALTRSANILAINARIEAARAGEHGKAFTVVASEMQRWSDEIQATNTIVQDLANSLASVLPEIANGIETFVERFKGEANHLTDGLHHLEKAQLSGNASIITTLGEIVELARGVHERSNRVLSHLQFHDYLGQRLRSLENIASKQSVLALDVLNWVVEQPDDATIESLRPRLLAMISEKLYRIDDVTVASKPAAAAASQDDDIMFFSEDSGT